MKLIELLKNEKVPYVMKNYLAESIKHPLMIAKENLRFLRNCSGKIYIPEGGLKWETHSHTRFSHDDPSATISLCDALNILFDNGYSFWSLTDHDSTKGFDSIWYGKYCLDNNNKSERQFEIIKDPEKRYMTIYSSQDENPLIMMRSVELMTDRGEINIHGYSGKIPEQGYDLFDAIKMAKDNGAKVGINHAHFWSGIGYSDPDNIEKTIELGADWIEENGTEIPPMSFDIIRSRKIAEKFRIPIIASGDAHKDFMYAISGVSLQRNSYEEELLRTEDQLEALFNTISSGNYNNFLNYNTPAKTLEFLSL
ncbi:MAG: PHP domain-containing protein [Candidatus Woesearchaeota archaeon]